MRSNNTSGGSSGSGSTSHRAAPQSQKRSSSSSSRISSNKQTSSNNNETSRSKSNNTTSSSPESAAVSTTSATSSNQNFFPYYSTSTTNKLILTSVLSQFLPVPLLLLPFIHLVYGFVMSIKLRFSHNDGIDEDGESSNRGRQQRSLRGSNNITTDEEENNATIDNKEYTDEDYDNDVMDIDNYDPKHRIQIQPSPALTTLLDTGLYKAYQSELVPTVSAASQLLQLYIEMKESAALLLRECKWCVGVPLSGGLVTVTKGGTVARLKSGVMKIPNNGSGSSGNNDVAIGRGGLNTVFLGGGVVVDEVSGYNLNDGMDIIISDESGAGGASAGISSGVIMRSSSTGTSGGIESLHSSIGSAGGGSGSGGSNSGSGGNNNNMSKEARIECMAAMEIAKWNEFDTIQDFAQQCYLIANEAIHRLTTDRLSDSANLTLQDSISESGNGNVGGDVGGGGGGSGTGGGNSGHQQQHQGAGDALNQSQIHQASASSPSSSAQPSSSLSSSNMTLADAGIGRCYEPLTRQNCWESPRLYCPDYTWADDAIGACQRSLKILSKHRFITLVATNGWDRYSNMMTISPQDGTRVIPTPKYASSTPHPFPSLEAVHCLQFLVSELLQTSIPASINKFRAATETNAVVSKRLYLVKCEYRAPMRALWESYTALNAAPRLELVESYLRDYHGVKPGEEQDSSSSTLGGGGRSSVLKKKLSSDEKKTAALLREQREKMEKLITEKYWKHPIFVEALQLERCCEKLEMDMSQMLLPLANVAREIMEEWKGRLRALASVREEGKLTLTPHIKWQDLPYWREFLRRLKSILCRKPGHDESTGIRPLLLDLQGVPRHNKDVVDSSIDISLYSESDPSNPWQNLEVFVQQVQLLRKVLNIPGMPILAEERLAGSKSDKATMHELVKKFNEVWDEEMFIAQYKDWFDLVTRQQELNAGTVTEDGEQQPSLTELAEAIRETEIELSIAMASKDQLQMVRKRLDDLRSSKAKRHAVLASIVQDVGMRELDEIIVVTPPEDDATAEFPELSDLGLFGEQLVMSGEELPLG